MKQQFIKKLELQHRVDDKNLNLCTSLWMQVKSYGVAHEENIFLNLEAAPLHFRLAGAS